MAHNGSKKTQKIFLLIFLSNYLFLQMFGDFFRFFGQFLAILYFWGPKWPFLGPKWPFVGPKMAILGHVPPMCVRFSRNPQPGDPSTIYSKVAQRSQVSGSPGSRKVWRAPFSPKNAVFVLRLASNGLNHGGVELSGCPWDI